MIYCPTDYLNYKYLVEVSDNYIVLSRDSFVNGDYMNPDSIDVVYVFNTPSFSTIESSISFTSYRSFTNISSDLTDNYYYCSDFPITLFVSLFLCFLFAIIINGFTRIVRPHGVLF